MDLTPKQLDEQSIVYLSGWLDLGSQRWRMTDDMPELTKEWVTMLTKDPAFLHADSQGRLWGLGNDGHYFPFHIECCGKLYGIRVVKKAAN
jgi:hypothetical protein